MENIFYLPINSGSLAHYFSRAIILPAKYLSNKQGDIQNNLSNTILLSKKKWVKNSDCSLEIILNDIEREQLIEASDPFFYCNTPIPISKVKSINFLDSKQKETTIWNINNGAAFIPERIVSVEKNTNIEPVSESTIQKGEKVLSVPDISEKVKRFDIILGGFAFMRLGGKSFMNYSPNYFATLSYFNKLIEEETNKAAKDNSFNFSTKYWGLFSNKMESEWSKWQPYIHQNINSKDIEKLAEQEGEKLVNKLGLIQIDSVSPASHLYVLAILATYGESKNKSTDDLVTDITNGTINTDKVEDVSIIFGLNSGYSRLRNKYRGAAKDYNVKFTLDSRLDYYIIESIFQFVFHGLKSSYSFDYIDNWFPTSKKFASIKGYETYQILDMTVIAKKKQTPLEFFLESYSTNIYKEIVKSIEQWLPPFAKNDEKMAIEYFQKHLRSVLTLSVEALQNRIEKDLEENYNTKKQEAIESHKSEVEKLLAELSSLKDDYHNLKSQNKTQPFNDHPASQEQKDDSLKSKETEEPSINLSVVQEPTERNYSESYGSHSLGDLKKIAKERGISKKIVDGFKKENKDELIALILKTPEPPKIL